MKKIKYVVWTVQALLALAMLATGAGKLITPREDLLAQMAWVEDFSQSSIWLIGIAEVAGAIGLIVPVATRIAPILTPLAASGLGVLMAGAAYTHIRRGEPFAGPSVFAAIAALLAVHWFRQLSRPAR